VNYRREIGIGCSVVHDDFMPTLEIRVALHKSRESLKFIFPSDEARSVRTEGSETRLLADKRVAGPVNSRVVDLHKSGLRELSSISL
jgi:hypothetical protein